MNAWLSFDRSFNDVVNFVNFFYANRRKCFFDFDNVSYASILFRGLSISLGLVRCQFIQFVALEKLGYFVNLLRRFGWDEREKSFDTSQEWFFNFHVGFLRSHLYPGSEFRYNFSP